MKQIVKYTAIDPYYSDQTQTYIGATSEEVLSIRRQTEEYMARNHSGLLSMIYKSEIVFDNTARPSEAEQEHDEEIKEQIKA